MDGSLVNDSPLSGMVVVNEKSAPTLDVIRNKVFAHRRKARLRWRTRKLCKPVAVSMKRSEHSAWVLRNTSFTQRERLMPQMACSTRTRARDKARLCRFSPGLRSFPRGFFSAGAFR